MRTSRGCTLFSLQLVVCQQEACLHDRHKARKAVESNDPLVELQICFSQLHSTVMCLRGSRSSQGHPVKRAISEASVELALCEELFL